MSDTTKGETAARSAALEPDDPLRVAERFAVEALLGRGGMASVYRVADESSGRQLALKLLNTRRKRAAEVTELFEREYHTLMQLAHPRVVRAYDYGVAGGQPYYTMELLDGGELRDLAPLPWQDVCRLAYEICSVLSLLHSRHLVHRDLTPRNVRRGGDGKSKLIDFGLLSPMGSTGLLAGTPPYLAPEVLHSMTADGRSDLFSLGATLYFALTGHKAFPATHFDQLRDLWRARPAPPSSIVSEIPAAVDQLVLSLLRIDVGSRPKSAAEVMDRLIPLLPSPPDDELGGIRAYLSTPRLVGREPIVGRLRKRIVSATGRRGGGFVILGEAGTGRTRVLDAFVLEAKLLGAITARASAEDATAPFGVARALIAQLRAALPDSEWPSIDDEPALAALLEAHEEAVSNHDAQHVQAALHRRLLQIADRRPLALAIDDLEHVDEPSATLLASLSLAAAGHRLVYAATFERSGHGAVAATPSEVLQQQAAVIELAPLGLDETTALLASVFGDVPNLQLLGRTLHALSAGRPRDCMRLAQHLLEQNTITYRGGAFTLPSELAVDALPADMGQAVQLQLARMSAMAHRIALLLSLGLLGRLSRAQLVELPATTPAEVDAALAELLSAQLVAGTPAGYTLRHPDLGPVIVARTSEAQRRETHRLLAERYRRAGVSPLAVGYHSLCSDNPAEGLDHILAHARDAESRVALVEQATRTLGSGPTLASLTLAVEVAERQQRPPRNLLALWPQLAGMSARGEDAAHYYRIAGSWLAHIKRDSGFLDWQVLDDDPDPATRARKAVAAAARRYEQTPEAERGLPPAEAIGHMLSFVVLSIAVGVRVLDGRLQAMLPGLLEPFAPLNPMADAMWRNALGTRLNGEGRYEAARETFLDVLARLGQLVGPGLAYLDKIKAAIAQTIAEIDACRGLHSPWIARLDSDDLDPNQLVSAHYIKKVVALHRGEWEAAEQHRRDAELLSLQSKARSMFSTLAHELDAHALARDLTGLRAIRSSIQAMAERYPGWVPVMDLANAHYLQLRGDLRGALRAACELAEQHPIPHIFPWAVKALALQVELLTELDRPAEALEAALPTLERCRREGMQALEQRLGCAVAAAEACCGRIEAALARLRAVVDAQQELGVCGLQLGWSYDHCARVAIRAQNAAAFREFSALAAEQYRAGEDSMLGGLYERLQERARQAGLIKPPKRPPHGRPAHHPPRRVEWPAP